MAALPPHSARKHRHQAGFLTVLLLIPLCIISYVLLTASDTTRTLLEIKNIIKQSVSIDNAIITDLLHTSFTSSGCKETTSSSQDKISPTVLGCIFWGAPFKTSPATELPEGVPDWNSIFESLHKCSGTLVSSREAVYTTPKTSHTCFLDTYLTQTNLVLPHNIEATQFTASSTADASHITVATSGSLTITDTLSTTSALLIIAGGDITISEITTPSSTTTSVVLLSAHGNISVINLAPQIEVLAIGRKALQVPTKEFLTRTPRLPSFVPKRLDGFIVK
jgi:hypothetical protein